jgi:hypothetical protein
VKGRVKTSNIACADETTPCLLAKWHLTMARRERDELLGLLAKARKSLHWRSDEYSSLMRADIVLRDLADHVFCLAAIVCGAERQRRWRRSS